MKTGLIFERIFGSSRARQIIAATLPIVSASFGGYIGLFLYSIGLDASFGDRLSILGAITVIASAALSFGGLLGFVFGVPRTLNSAINDNNRQTSSDTPERELEEVARNTNLEQISDWLTKILVGISLTRIGPITSFFYQSVIVRVAPGFIPQGREDLTSLSISVAIGSILFYMVTGFLLGYLWTSIYLTYSLNEHSVELRRDVNKAQESIDKVQWIRLFIDAIPDFQKRHPSYILPSQSIPNKDIDVIYKSLEGRYKDIVDAISEMSISNENILRIPSSLSDFLDGMGRRFDQDASDIKYVLRSIDFLKLGSLYLYLRNEPLVAIRFFDECINLNQFSYDGYIMKGLALIRDNRLDEAISCFTKAIDIDKENYMSWSYLGSTYLWKLRNIGNHNEDERNYFSGMALKNLKRASKLNPFNVNVLSGLGWAYAESSFDKHEEERKSAEEEEEKVYIRALDIDPDSPFAWYNLACLKARTGYHEKAIEFLGKALDIKPELKSSALSDPSFQPLHSLPSYQKIMS